MGVRRRPVLVEFTDRFGEQQVIHRGSSAKLQIRRKAPTVIIALAHAVGQHIGQRVKAYRLERGMTLLELANRAGIKGGKEHMHTIETAMDTGVRIGTLYALARALDVPVVALLPSDAKAFEDSGVRFDSTERLAV